MVESEARVLPEEQMLGAVMFGHQQIQTAIDAISDLAERAGKPAWDWQPPETDQTLTDQIEMLARTPLEQAYDIADKKTRQEKLSGIRSEIAEKIATQSELEDDQVTTVKETLKNLESEIVRGRILNGQPRIDGRDLNTCLLYTSPSPRDRTRSRMPSSA